MPISVENGFQSREDGKGSWSEEATTSSDTHDRRDSIREPRFLSEQQLPIHSDKHLAVKDKRRLPSPSPTPSPRSSSPSLVLTNSSSELTGTPSTMANEMGYSGSFEKATLSPASGKSDESVLQSPLPISKTLSPHELHDIPEERVRKPPKPSTSKLNVEDKVLKLTAAEIEELTSAPGSLPVASPRRPSVSSQGPPILSPFLEKKSSTSDSYHHESSENQRTDDAYQKSGAPEGSRIDSDADRRPSADVTPGALPSKRPAFSSRTTSTPTVTNARISSYSKGTPGQASPKRKPMSAGSRPEFLDLNYSKSVANGGVKHSEIEPPSPIPQALPIPPMSMPTYLQLELSSSKPSPLYIYRSAASEYPYESSRIKFERLLNFLLLPPQLEQVLYFGSLACLDAWLYTFTILPLRFFKALAILLQWWGHVLATEARFIGGFIYHGVGRMWNRQRERGASVDSPARSRSVSQVRRQAASTTPTHNSRPVRRQDPSRENATTENLKAESDRMPRRGWGHKHRRTKSQPSSLSSNHKADLLQGAVIICSCIILMKLDASRMYHSIRGQAAIKLYVIYNALEV